MTHYILEAQKFTHNEPAFIHVGYVNHLFNSRQEAVEFYAEQYPGHKPVTESSDWKSDWSAWDGLRYVVVAHGTQNLELRDRRDNIASSRLDRLDEQIRLKVRLIHDYRPPSMDWAYPEY